LIFSTVAPTARRPSPITLNATELDLAASRKTSVSIVSGATGTGRIRSTVTRAIPHLVCVGIFSAPDRQRRRRRTVLHARVHGPAALGW